jgi:hypothetical protein
MTNPSRRAPWPFALILAGTVAGTVVGCHSIGLALAPEKTPQPATGEAASLAKSDFQATLARGDYASLDEVTERLTAAYLQAPRDPELALYVAHAHFWRVAERSREPSPRATITDHLEVAEAYFAQARALRPDDRRIDGWLGGVRLALGAIHDDERTRRRGYFDLQDGVRHFPEFNHFSKGYAMSSLGRGDARFSEVVEDMWASIDACGTAPIRRDVPDYARVRPAPVATGPRRVCDNGPIAPHNFEGFFLHDGDVLVKAGRPAAAKVMYANARLSTDYGRWPYREALEERIRTADARAAAFGGPDPRAWPEMMVGSRLACTGCHQR